MKNKPRKLLIWIISLVFYLDDLDDLGGLQPSHSKGFRAKRYMEIRSKVHGNTVKGTWKYGQRYIEIRSERYKEIRSEKHLDIRLHKHLFKN